MNGYASPYNMCGKRILLLSERCYGISARCFQGQKIINLNLAASRSACLSIPAYHPVQAQGGTKQGALKQLSLGSPGAIE